MGAAISHGCRRYVACFADGMLRASLALSIVLAAGCAGRDEPTQHLSAPATEQLTLLVSNQSFDLDRVGIRIELDGQLAVTGDFDVEGQHTWVPFELPAAPGTHTLRVTSTGGSATLDETFVMDDRKWGVVMFWFDQDSTEIDTPYFSWALLDEQPAFD